MNLLFKTNTDIYIWNPIKFKNNNPKIEIEVAPGTHTGSSNISKDYQVFNGPILVEETCVIALNYNYISKINSLKKKPLNKWTYKQIKKILDAFFIEDFFLKLFKDMRTVKKLYSDTTRWKLYLLLNVKTSLKKYKNIFFTQSFEPYVPYKLWKNHYYNKSLYSDDFFKYVIKEVSNQKIKSGNKYTCFYSNELNKHFESEQIKKIKKIMQPKGHYYYLKNDQNDYSFKYSRNKTYQKKINKLLKQKLQDYFVDEVIKSINNDMSLIETKQKIIKKKNNYLKSADWLWEVIITIEKNYNFILKNYFNNLYNAVKKIYKKNEILSESWKIMLKEKIMPDFKEIKINNRDYYRITKRRL